jgi:hypothetical protein
VCRLIPTAGSNPALSANGGYIGPFAAQSSEPRQIRKEAAVIVDAGAEVWLV